MFLGLPGGRAVRGVCCNLVGCGLPAAFGSETGPAGMQCAWSTSCHMAARLAPPTWHHLGPFRGTTWHHVAPRKGPRALMLYTIGQRL